MKVGIIGGGIGGLTTALALQKKGIEFTLFESAPELRAAGAGIWMSPNSIRVMNHLGLADDFLRLGREMDFVATEDSGGGLISRIPMDKIRQKHGYAIHSVRRQTLHNLLAGKIEPGRILTGKNALSVQQNSGRVTVSFADGSSSEFDILIGADGIRSAVREAVNPGVPLRYSGQTCWYGLSDAKLPANRKKQTTEMWMGKIRFGFTEVDGGQVYFFAVEKSPAGVSYSGNRVKYLQELYKDAPAIVGTILAGAKSENIIKNDLNDIKPFIPLAYGRIVLIGDAGHATTPNLGQGAAQAMEDGVLLAELLSRHINEPEHALKQFEKMRKNRITHIVKTSWQQGKLSHGEGFWGKTVVQGIMKRIPEAVMMKLMDRVLRPVFP